MVKVEFLTFEQIHGKKNIGSTNIRVHQLIKQWPEASLYKYGSKPDVLIFQKVYWLPDYHFVEHFDGIKILDICDPDWVDNAYVKRTIDNCDAVVVPSDEMQRFIQQLTDKPVKVIKDRFDLSLIPEPKEHTKKKDLRAVWFGYSHNAEVLRFGAVTNLERLGIGLTVIADEDPFAYRWASEKYKSKYKYIKYNEETIYKELQKCDICILPTDTRPKGIFKSDNKTTKAMLAGLPVAKTIDQLEGYMDNNKRNEDAKKNYQKARQDYDVLLSIKEYQELIDELRNTQS